MSAGPQPTSAAGGDWSRRAGAYAASSTHADGPSLAKVALLAALGPGQRALDVGTGAGHTAALLAASGADVVALDPAAGMLEAARQRYGHLERLSFLLAEGASTGMPGGSFDLVTARHTLHHHRDLPRTLRELWRVLRPGGRLLIVDEVTPSPEVDGWYDALERARDGTHVRARTMEEWRALLDEAGFNWIVGDSLTRYTIEVQPWLERSGAGAQERERVELLLQHAPPEAVEQFSIEYEEGSGRAVAFLMPMALILAMRPEGEA